MKTESELLNYLTTYGFLYQRVEHPPVYTCEEADRYVSGASTKNLFLQGDGCYLVMLPCSKRVDFKALAARLVVPHLSFAPEKKLQEYLGVGLGAVSLFGLINDPQNKVQLIVDTPCWTDPILCHPLVNTSTLIMGLSTMTLFLRAINHQVLVLDVPYKI